MNTKMGIDPWLPMESPRAPLLAPNANPELIVQTLIDQAIQQWDDEKLSTFVDP